MIRICLFWSKYGTTFCIRVPFGIIFGQKVLVTNHSGAFRRHRFPFLLAKFFPYFLFHQIHYFFVYRLLKFLAIFHTRVCLIASLVIFGLLSSIQLNFLLFAPFCLLGG